MSWNVEHLVQLRRSRTLHVVKMLTTGRNLEALRHRVVVGVAYISHGRPDAELLAAVAKRDGYGYG